jgi:hypothetical protein
MKIQTNLHAGKQNRGSKTKVDDNPGPESEVSVPPVTRCTGL